MTYLEIAAQMVLDGYSVGAPSQEIEELDAPVAERYPCRQCGGRMRYAGFHKPGQNGRCREYVALAICTACGHQVSF